MSQPTPFADAVCEVVATADSVRRRREAATLVSRYAPFAAGLLLLVSLITYFVHGSVLVIIGALVCAVGGLSWFGWAIRRARPVTDEVAARIDADAGLNGELRSAHWFAVREVGDEWVSYHLEQAAAETRNRIWQEVYPPVKAHRAWAVTAVLVLSAFALPLSLPSWPSGARTVVASQPVVDAVAPDALALLPPELQAQIFDLLAAVEAGTLKAADAMERIKHLPGFTTAPPDVQTLIADALAEAERREQDVARGSNPDAAEPPPQATTDTQWARENMASRLANEQARANDGLPEEMQDRGDESTKTEDKALGESGEASAGQASAKVPTKDPAAAQGATGMMLQSGANGDPGSAFGGKKGNVRYGTVEASQLAAALKREQVEALANVDSSDLRSEDKRRKTEQSWSAIKFSHVTRRTSFDRARVDAPRVVPEARRPLVERYFVRQAEDVQSPQTGVTSARPPSSGNESSR